MPLNTDNRYRDFLREEGAAAGEARQARREFDPRSATREAARASFEEIQRPMREGLERIRGDQVGAGRLRTGFGFEDQDRFVRGLYEDLNRELARNALSEAGLTLRNIEGMDRSRNRYLDALSGERERQIAQERIESEEKQAMFEAAGGLLGLGASLIF